MKSPSDQTISQETLSKLFGMTDTQIEDAVKKHSLPREKGKTKKYNITRAIQWLVSHQKKQLEEAAKKKFEWTVEEVARAIRKDVRWINVLAKEKGLPRVSRGVYNIIDVVRYLLSDLEHKLEEAKAGGEDALNAKRKEAMYNALITEMEYFEKAKMIVNVDDVGQKIMPLWKATQTKMRALPRQLAPQIFGLSSIVEVEELLERAIHESLTESANIPVAFVGPRKTGGDNRERLDRAPSSRKSKHK